MKKVAFVLVCGSLAGCSGQKIVLENAQGEQVVCEYSTGKAMLTGAAMRNARMNQCTQSYQSQGYTKVVEAEHKL